MFMHFFKNNRTKPCSEATLIYPPKHFNVYFPAPNYKGKTDI